MASSTLWATVPWSAAGSAPPSAAVGRFVPAVGATLQARPAERLQGDTFGCQLPTDPFFCYGPAQVRTAYDVNPVLEAGVDGTRRTIVIVDAFQNPTMAGDLAAFDTTFGLPAPPSFITIAPQGLTPYDVNDPNQLIWSGEIALDVEWSHSIAPGAKIVLVLAKSSNDPDVYAAEKYAVDHDLGDVMSLSLGEGEACINPALMVAQHRLFGRAKELGMTVVAATGDVGAAQYGPSASKCANGTGIYRDASTPASDPGVTAVGGTTLHADLTTGAYHDEVVWNEPDQAAAGGGGFSDVYVEPTYQYGTVVDAHRGVPDVSMNASIDYGELVAWGSSGQDFEYWVFGGTSIATPQWAAIVAMTDQYIGKRAGLINPALYALGRSAAAAKVFHDITVGNNDFPPVRGYKAAVGWDPASGWGTPVVSQLVPALAAQLTR